jgi:hypothetical protein
MAGSSFSFLNKIKPTDKPFGFMPFFGRIRARFTVIEKR